MDKGDQGEEWMALPVMDTHLQTPVAYFPLEKGG
jgi:hypothetical protein